VAGVSQRWSSGRPGAAKRSNNHFPCRIDIVFMAGRCGLMDLAMERTSAFRRRRFLGPQLSRFLAQRQIVSFAP
jgi:hypothetical protein